jgi:formylglycine-generating enzyme required for sulfatase activity
MAKLGRDARRPDLATAESCIDRESQRAGVTETPLEDEMSRTFPSVQGSFGKGDACPEANADAPWVCVPGGALVLGSRALSFGTSTRAASTPERTAVVSRFWMDRNEVTVARVRAAVARGFLLDPTAIAANNRSFPPTGGAFDEYCSWSTTPRDRENYAVTCVNWEVARAFCRNEGGELPTETQWEYAAAVAGHRHKSFYPWGDDEPGCDRAVIGRGLTRFGDRSCVRGDVKAGPQPVEANAATDVTPLGIVGLGGGVQEWTLDSGQSYEGACWDATPMFDPACREEAAPMRTVRGGNWAGRAGNSAERVHLPPGMAAFGIPDTASGYPTVGFRCVYRARP